jgi:hypothetical protein
VEFELVGNARTVPGKEKPNCVNCAYYKFIPESPAIFSSPSHHCTAAIDLVTGKPIETDCYAMRHPRCECGPDAALFKPKSD